MWLAVISRPSQQRTAEWNLTNQGCQTFAPQRTVKRQKRGVWEWHNEYRFERYLFCLPNGLAVRTVLSSRGVSSIVKHADGRPWYMSPADMEDLMGICAATSTMEKKAADWFIDQRLTVRDGPFAGLSGTVQKILKGKIELLVEERTNPLLSHTSSLRITLSEHDLAPESV